MKTKKECFDEVKAHLLRQMARSEEPDITFPSGKKCLYRGPNGMKCAAGALIDDKYFNFDYNCESAYTHEVQDMLRKSGVPDDALYMVFSLQKIHDKFEPSEWAKELDNLESYEFPLK